MDLLTALQTKDVLTENGMATHSTSSDANVDLFFAIGAMRGQDLDRLYSLFTKAFYENPLTAMKILFWSRDIREGAGERQIFRDILWHLINTGHSDVVLANISLIPLFGRWDDISVLFNTNLQENALKMISEALMAGDSLCAKWMPRKGPEANILRKYMKLSPKEYRKLLVELTNVVENKMCSKQWDDIEFDKLPSVASARYQRAFGKRATEAYGKYINALQKGEAKINAGAVYPYDVVKSLNTGNTAVANEQWNALPNFMADNTQRILPVVDVSGSMVIHIGKSNITAMDISTSLGLYISERNTGPFKDSFITFSSKPELQVLKGTLQERYNQLVRSHWGYSTNLDAVFTLILDKAVEFKLSSNDMPTIILILSDMEFDEACGDRNRFWHDEERQKTYNKTAQEMISDKYKAAGYDIPNIVYWNIASRHANVPVKKDELGTALISGFSPSILKSVLSGETLVPEKIMLKTINNERYNDVTLGR